MKKIYFAVLALAALTLASCEKDPIGGTAVQALSGQWSVTNQAVKSDTVRYDDPWGAGPFLLLTYNNNANDADKLIINDRGKFWDFNVEASCDLNTLTFGNPLDTLENLAYEGCQVVISNGKILKGAAKTPSGAVADSIVFDVWFSDDGDAAEGTWDRLRFTGYRYTGLKADGFLD